MTRFILFALVALLATSVPAQDAGKTWATAVATRPSDGRQIVFRFIQEYLPSFDRSKFPVRVTLSWRYESATGMPSAPERESMDQFEDLVGPQVESPLLASLALVRTGDNLRQWTYYTTSEDAFRAKFGVAVRSAPQAPVELKVEPDPAWEKYEQFRSGVHK